MQANQVSQAHELRAKQVSAAQYMTINHAQDMHELHGGRIKSDQDIQMKQDHHAAEMRHSEETHLMAMEHARELHAQKLESAKQLARVQKTAKVEKKD